MPTVLVDANNIYWAAHGAMRQLSFEGTPTGGAFGTFKTLAHVREKFHGYEIRMLWDSWSWRREHDSDYKGQREGAGQYDMMDWTKDTCLRLGITNHWASGFEADDLAYALRDTSPPLVYVSGDADWLQLVAPGRSVYQPRSKKLVAFSNFKHETGWASTKEFVIAKSIMGDDSDNIPGCPGIGPAKTYQHLTGQKSHPEILQFLESERYKLNLKLIDLSKAPYKDLVLVTQEGTWDPDRAKIKFLEFGMRSLTSPEFLGKFGPL